MTDHRNVSTLENTWSKTPIEERCCRIAAVASLIAERGEHLAEMCRRDWREDHLTTVSGELLPLCAALKWIGRHGVTTLSKRRLGGLGRPLWLWGVRHEIHRKPRGEVLVLGAWNYPLLLVGVQIAQALAAGNIVKFKPAEGCEEIGNALASAFYDAGVPESALQVLHSSAAAAVDAIEQGVDLIVLTGSASTGRAVFRQAAETLTPMILELSGSDAVVACPSANPQRVAESIAFGLKFNSGATCIGPRRLIAEQKDLALVLGHLIPKLSQVAPLAIHPAAKKTVLTLISRALEEGAEDLTGCFSFSEFERTGRMPPLVFGGLDPESELTNADIFAPVLCVLPVENISQSVKIVNRCRYRLAASLFGNQSETSVIADQLSVGSVTINDLIVPTADPRVPFGGRGESGFGVTRGAEGLLEMTVPMLQSRRTSHFIPHLVFNREEDSKTLLSALKIMHGGKLATRVKGMWQVARHAMQRKE